MNFSFSQLIVDGVRGAKTYQTPELRVGLALKFVLHGWEIFTTYFLWLERGMYVFLDGVVSFFIKNVMVRRFTRPARLEVFAVPSVFAQYWRGLRKFNAYIPKHYLMAGGARGFDFFQPCPQPITEPPWPISHYFGWLNLLWLVPSSLRAAK